MQWGKRGASLARWVAATAIYLYFLRRWWPAPTISIVTGVIYGSLYALVAFGVGIVHRATRVVNMAQADMGVFPGAIFASLLLEKGWSYWRSLVAALVVAALLGMAVQLVLRTLFSRAPRMVVMVATVGIGQFLFAYASHARAWIEKFNVRPRFGGFGGPSPYGLNAWAAPLNWHLTIGPGEFNGNDIIAVLVAVAALPLLHLFMHRTRSGLGLRAGAENGPRTSMLGVNLPRIHLVVWAVAAMLSTLSFVLRAGMFGVPNESLFGPRYMARALAIAAVGRMQHFGVMFAAAIGFGIVESSMRWNAVSDFVLDGVLLGVVVIALFTMPRRDRAVDDGATATWREAPVATAMPRELGQMLVVRAAKWLMILALVGGVALIPSRMEVGSLFLATDIVLCCIVGISLVIFTGWAGQISLGHFVFVGFGACAGAAVVNAHHIDLSFAALVGGGAATLAAIGLALVLQRRVDPSAFALLTLVLAVATPFLLVSEVYIPELRVILPNTLHWAVYRYPLFGRFSLYYEEPYFAVAAVALGVILVVARNLQRSRTARVIVAGRENRRAATAFGLDVARTQLTALAISGFIAGFAGALLALHRRGLPADLWDPTISLRLVAAVVIGGASSVVGAAAGVALSFSILWFDSTIENHLSWHLFGWLPFIGNVTLYNLMTYVAGGGGMVLVLAFLPGGVAGLAARLRNLILSPIARLKGIDGPSPGRRLDVVATVISAPGRLLRRVTPAPALGTRTGALLELRDVTARYGPMQVLFGVDLDVEEGTILGLLGTNGAGKSTLLHAITGTVDATGSVRFDGRELAGLSTHRIARLGVAQAPGGRGVFPSLTVQQHLNLAATADNWHPRRRAASIGAALDRFPALRARLDQPAGTLSKGEQQMLTIAMALVTRPRVLLIDELSLGLAPGIVDQLLTVVRQLRREGMTIVLVEQSVDLALRIADEVCFLEQGELRFRGPAEELRERPDLLRAVFLHRHDDLVVLPPERPAVDPGLAVLEARGISKRFGLTVAADRVDLSVGVAEIVGIVGPNGAGKTTLLDIMSGFVRADEGSILVAGRDITSAAASARARLGVARSLQDARLFGALTCHETVMVALDPRLTPISVVSDALNLPASIGARRRASARADELLAMLGLERWRDRFCEELSTGTRRILDLGCQLALDPRVILLDEPSSGIAQREAEAMVPLLRRLRDDTGVAMLVIEHDIPVISELADRMVAMHLGRVVAEGDPAAVLADPIVEEAYLGRVREAEPYATL